MFKLLLYTVSLILKRASKTNPSFKNYIGNINISIAIKTKSNNGRTFIFNRGRVTSSSSLEHYDAALVFSDEKTAFDVLKKGSQEAVFCAAAQGKLYVEGMAVYIQWFNDAINIALRRNRKEVL
ncbi:MAG: hypothetical protein ACP5JP_05980 [bacterium]